MNILLVRLSSLGDILHVLPSLRALRQSFPGARLGWVVEDSFKDLLSGLPELDHLYILSRERSRGSWKEQLQLGREMKSRLQQVPWDVAIDFQGLWKSLRVCRWARAKRILGYSPSPERTHFFYTDPVPLPSMDRHAVDRHLDLISTLGCSIHSASYRGEFTRDFTLPLTPANRQRAAAILSELDLPPESPRVLLNFSARKPANRWGVDRFAALADALAREGISPVLTGGPDDHEEERQILERVTIPLRSIVARGRLLDLAALMPSFDLAVTGDTGPMHIAVAMKVPVVAIFGPANPVRTGPYSPEAVVLQAPRECQPCYARTCQYKQMPPPCLTDITVEAVTGTIQKILQQKTTSPMEIDS